MNKTYQLSYEQITNKDRDGTGLSATENYSAWTAQEMIRPDLSSPTENFFQKSQEQISLLRLCLPKLEEDVSALENIFWRRNF